MKDVSFRPSPFDRESDIFVEEETKEVVAFQLTDDELLKTAKQTSEFNSQLKLAKGQFAQVKSDWSGKIKGIESQINYNHMIIGDQAEDREIDCVKRRIFNRKVVQFLYHGRVVKERPMQEYEMTHPQNMQASLNGAQSHTV